MGTDRLQHLAQHGSAELASVVAALSAELRTIAWDGPEAFLQFYPSAEIDGQHIEITLDETHCVKLIVNYETGCMLVESAGPRVTRAKKETRK